MNKDSFNERQLVKNNLRLLNREYYRLKHAELIEIYTSEINKWELSEIDKQELLEYAFLHVEFIRAEHLRRVCRFLTVLCFALIIVRLFF